MKNNYLLIVSTAIFTIFSSCQKTYSDQGDAVKTDADATLFITNAKIDDALTKVAITNFVIQLKNDSLWNKFGAIYPMVGGTPFSTKWNLKDPRDLDAAYRITWNGSPVVQSSGVTCLTADDWGDTHFIDTALSYTNSSMSFYSGTQNQVAGYDMGCSNDIYPFNIFSIYEDFSKDIVNTLFDAYGTQSYQPSVTTGLFTNSSYGGQVVRYDNGVQVANYGAPKVSYTNVPVTIGKVLDDPYLGLRECRLAAMGQGLSGDAALKFYNAVKSFETNIAR